MRAPREGDLAACCAHPHVRRHRRALHLGVVPPGGTQGVELVVAGRVVRCLGHVPCLGQAVGAEPGGRRRPVGVGGQTPVVEDRAGLHACTVGGHPRAVQVVVFDRGGQPVGGGVGNLTPEVGVVGGPPGETVRLGKTGDVYVGVGGGVAVGGHRARLPGCGFGPGDRHGPAAGVVGHLPEGGPVVGANPRGNCVGGQRIPHPRQQACAVVGEIGDRRARVGDPAELPAHVVQFGCGAVPVGDLAQHARRRRRIEPRRRGGTAARPVLVGQKDRSARHRIANRRQPLIVDTADGDRLVGVRRRGVALGYRRGRRHELAVAVEHVGPAVSLERELARAGGIIDQGGGVPLLGGLPAGPVLGPVEHQPVPEAVFDRYRVVADLGVGESRIRRRPQRPAVR
ncbi:MAG: hypothetical protein JJLCMIEE_01064 [Acidimicrobiales bacterium]|nr:hypothetical protein [Acidimicrobiales bacterium]